MNECLQSIRLIVSALNFMNHSRYNTDLNSAQLMESMINGFKLISEGHNLPARSAYVNQEAPKGELGLCMIIG